MFIRFDSLYYWLGSFHVIYFLLLELFCYFVVVFVLPLVCWFCFSDFSLLGGGCLYLRGLGCAAVLMDFVFVLCCLTLFGVFVRGFDIRSCLLCCFNCLFVWAGCVGGGGGGLWLLVVLWVLLCYSVCILPSLFVVSFFVTLLFVCWIGVMLVVYAWFTCVYNLFVVFCSLVCVACAYCLLFSCVCFDVVACLVVCLVFWVFVVVVGLRVCWLIWWLLGSGLLLLWFWLYWFVFRYVFVWLNVVSAVELIGGWFGVWVVYCCFMFPVDLVVLFVVQAMLFVARSDFVVGFAGFLVS